MFTTGQAAFAIFFVILFTIFMVYSYRKDQKFHKREFKGSRWVLIGFIGFVVLLFVIKFLLKG